MNSITPLQKNTCISIVTSLSIYIFFSECTSLHKVLAQAYASFETRQKH